jgi:hypothetical protein
MSPHFLAGESGEMWRAWARRYRVGDALVSSCTSVSMVKVWLHWTIILPELS